MNAIQMLRLAFILFFALCAVSCHREQPTATPSPTVTANFNDERQARAEKIICELADEYKADERWTKTLERDDPVYTLEVQKGIESLNGKPVVFVAFIVDVYQVGTRYRIFCQHMADSTVFGSVHFLLDTDAETALAILEAMRGVTDFVFNDEFVFVASLNHVDVVYEQEREAVVSDEKKDDELPDAYITESGLYPGFIVKGECRKAVHLANE